MTDLSCLFICPRFGSIHRGAEAAVEALAFRLPTYGIHPAVLSYTHKHILPNVEMLFAWVLKREYTEHLERIRAVRDVLVAFGLRPGPVLESASLYLSASNPLRGRVFDVIVPVGGLWTYKLAKKSFPEAKLVAWGQAGPVEREIALADTFIGITEIDAMCASELTAKPVLHIPNGVDTEVFSLQPHPPSTPTILCCAAFSEFKRLNLLLDAVGFLDTSVRVILAGRGNQEATLKKHRTCRTHRVEFTSRTWREMPDLYKQATIFSLPSPNETFGIVFLEALATGLNVVAHDAAAQRYVLGERGYYADVYAADAYAKKLALAMSNPEPQANRARAKLFSWDRTAEEFASIVMSITQDKAKNG